MCIGAVEKKMYLIKFRSTLTRRWSEYVISQSRKKICYLRSLAQRGLSDALILLILNLFAWKLKDIYLKGQWNRYLPLVSVA
jgi:hypothetical protein